MSRQNILMSKLQEGDVIAVKNSLNGAPSKGWQYALVITPPVKKAGQVQGVEVFMLKGHDPSEYLPNDPYHYMYGTGYENESIKNLMGLHDDKNWRLRYHIDFIPNDTAYLGLEEIGKVRKTGSITNDPAFNKIVYHASTLNLTHINGPSISDEDRKKLGLQQSTFLTDIEQTGGVERGKNIKAEIKRQDAGADTSADMGQIVPSGKRKPRKNKQLTEVLTLNISLEDADKLNIITRNFRNVLSAIKNTNGESITTLREAWLIATQKPELLKDIYAEANNTTMTQARETGLLEMPEGLYQTIMKSFSDGRRSNDPDPTVDFVYKILFDGENGNPDRILGLFDDEDDKIDVIDDIQEAWLSLPINTTTKRTPKNLDSKIVKIWSKFAEEATTNPVRFSDAGIKPMLPDVSP